MHSDEAAQILGVAANAAPEPRRQAFDAQRTKLETKISQAPTSGLKAKYQEGIQRLEEAFETLELASDAADLPSMRTVVESPSSIPQSENPSAPKPLPVSDNAAEAPTRMVEKSAPAEPEPLPESVNPVRPKKRRWIWIVLGAICLFVVLIIMPALQAAKSKAQLIECGNHLRFLKASFDAYRSDHSNRFPPAETWVGNIHKYFPLDTSYNGFLKCPAGGNKDGYSSGYTFNAQLAGSDASVASSDTVLLFETDAGGNSYGGREKIVKVPRHGQFINVLFVDGTVKALKPEETQNLKW